jgi:hypothetical protein
VRSLRGQVGLVCSERQESTNSHASATIPANRPGRLDWMDWVSHVGAVGSFLALCLWTGIAALVGLGHVPQLWSCPWKTLTGISCPFCGLTRSLASAVRGDWQASFGYHPLGIAIVVILAGFAWLCVRGMLRGTPVRLGPMAAWSLCLFAIVCWIIKLALLGAYE